MIFTSTTLIETHSHLQFLTVKKTLPGEIDFIVYNPDIGILVLEIKGGTISYANGQWIQENHKIDPVSQAKFNKYKLMDILRERLNLNTLPLKFAHAFCFPDIKVAKSFPIEVEGLVITGNNLKKIKQLILNIFENTPLPRFAEGEIDRAKILKVLNPIFEYGVRLFERIDNEENKFITFTESQWRILEALNEFKRLRVLGCAGSGKTILAIKKARQLAAQGKDVLLVCYNQMLASHFQNATKDYVNIKAVAFFEFCKELLRIPEAEFAKYKDNPNLYRRALPRLLSAYVENKCVCYDCVIVDEGQDFSKEAWDSIEKLVSVDGYFYIFYDPDQNIFEDSLHIPTFDLPPVKLNRNCRSTKAIFEHLKPFISDECAAPFDGAPDGLSVLQFEGDSDEKRRQILNDVVSRVVNFERVSPPDIVILGGHSLEHTCVGANRNLACGRIVPRISPKGSNDISFFTYMKFKGLEAKVIILIDVDENDPRWANRKALYTAMSRARHLLIIISKSPAK